MGKRTQIDKAIETLDAKREALIAASNAEIGGLDAAITALRAQQRTKPKPRVVREMAAAASDR